MGLSSWVLKKLVWTVLAFVAVYLTASAFGLLPDSMKQTVDWFGNNFETIAFAGCFVIGCYTILKFLNRRKGSTTH